MKNWQFVAIGTLIGLILSGILFLMLRQQKPAEFSYISPTYSHLASVDSVADDLVKKVNINTATVEELVSLPGIGEEKAKAIVEFREKNGKFASIEDVLYVTGIGDSIFAQIRDKITV
jgi:comEA protein